MYTPSQASKEQRNVILSAVIELLIFTLGAILNTVVSAIF